MTANGGNALRADFLDSNWPYKAAQLCMLKHSLSSPSLINWDSLDAYDGATCEDLSSLYAGVSLVAKIVELDACDLLDEGVESLDLQREWYLKKRAQLQEKENREQHKIYLKSVRTIKIIN